VAKRAGGFAWGFINSRKILARRRRADGRAPYDTHGRHRRGPPRSLSFGVKLRGYPDMTVGKAGKP
jgi:hypothetical protein